jgi:hypothetical protein
MICNKKSSFVLLGGPTKELATFCPEQLFTLELFILEWLEWYG